MKDLYKRLHVPPTAREDEIRAALANADPESREAAEFVLLHPSRRAVYDRHHRLLTTVAQLRSRLALGLRPFWSHAHHQDFNVPFAATRTPGKLDPLNVMEGTGRGRGRVSATAWILALVLILALAIGAWWFSHR